MLRNKVSRKYFLLRAQIVSGLFIFATLLLLTRLYFVQIVHGASYAQEAIGQYTAQNPEAPARGSIYFTTADGALVTAATQQNGWRVAINPTQLGDPSQVYKQLSAVIPLDKTGFMASVGKKNDPYEEIAYRLTDDQARKVQALNITGVILVADEWRFYPGGTLGAQTLGFVGYGPTGSTKTGVYGLEKEYDNTLSETNNGLYINPFAEIFTSLSSALSTDPAAHEGSVVTSIDPEVESQLEKTLDQVLKQYSPTIAGGIIMDPTTGAIYGMGSRPGFDPNAYGAVTNPSYYDNTLVSGRYELGSIMKPLTMAAGIDSGAIATSTTYDDTGCITVSGFQVCNYDLRARGVIPMQQILSQSLNVGASWVATKTGYPTFTKYMKSYGLGEKTGIDLPNEVTGDLSNLDNGSGPAVNFDTASFGQGIVVSPIEMIRALSALANGGTLPPPHVALAVKYNDGITRSISYLQGPRVISAASSKTVTGMLETVYDDALGNGKYKMLHYTAAAKTGTAQLPMPGGGYYPGNVFLHSFFGYFPASAPRFIIFLFAVRPQGVEYASASLAPAYFQLEQFLINYYDIPPDR